MNIFEKIKKKKGKIVCLAPMEDVTDTVFRQILLKCGRPDIFFSEFTNCSALTSKGKENALQRLKYIKEEKPILAQLWGNNSKTYQESIKICIDLGFDGIDINMGCPDKEVVKTGAGGALIENPDLAKEIINESKNAILKYSKNKISLSVKTRIGFDEIDSKWIEFLLSQKLDAITFHARTVKELSKTKANWDIFKEIIPLRNIISKETIIIGNGDIFTKEQMNTYPDIYGVDGVMIARGIFNNLWIFNKNIDVKDISKEERINLLIHHINLFSNIWKNEKNTETLKKFFKIYIKDFDGASSLREKLMNEKDFEKILFMLKNIS